LFGVSWLLNEVGRTAFMHERHEYCADDNSPGRADGTTFTECFAERRQCDFLENSLQDDMACVFKGATKQVEMIHSWFASSPERGA